eukprot:scaffold37916_cov137-Amphora_coffeaeformis.AAC.1
MAIASTQRFPWYKERTFTANINHNNQSLPLTPSTLSNSWDLVRKSGFADQVTDAKSGMSIKNGNQ